MPHPPDESSPARHIPVMAETALEILDIRPGMMVVDATCGLLGHTLLMLERLEGSGRLIAIDRDPQILELARQRLREEGVKSKILELVSGSYAQLEEILAERGIKGIDRILFDLGANSAHFDLPERGFSFATDAPLSMQYDAQESGESAAELVNRLSENELARLIKEFGEERRAKRVARAIVERRKMGKIETTQQLAEIVRKVVFRSHRDRIDPATRTFQALRIACNRELDHLREGLPQALNALNEDGIAVTIAFHSGEDRICKMIMGKAAGRLTEIHDDPCPGTEFNDKFELITKKPLRPGEDETRRNPRSRSAKLRAVRKVAT